MSGVSGAVLLKYFDVYAWSVKEEFNIFLLSATVIAITLVAVVGKRWVDGETCIQTAMEKKIKH